MAHRFASSTEQEIEKLLKQKDSENKRRPKKIAKELFHEKIKEKSVQKPEDKKDTNVEIVCRYIVYCLLKQCIIKQLLDSVFAISGILKVSVGGISLSLRLRLITVASTLIIPDTAKTSFNNCLISVSFSQPLDTIC